jgi:hypothetical protein
MRHRLGVAALAVGIGTWLAAAAVGQDGPILPGLDALPPAAAAPVPRRGESELQSPPRWQDSSSRGGPPASAAQPGRALSPADAFGDHDPDAVRVGRPSRSQAAGAGTQNGPPRMPARSGLERLRQEQRRSAAGSDAAAAERYRQWQQQQLHERQRQQYQQKPLQQQRPGPTDPAAIQRYRQQQLQPAQPARPATMDPAAQQRYRQQQMQRQQMQQRERWLQQNPAATQRTGPQPQQHQPVPSMRTRETSELEHQWNHPGQDPRSIERAPSSPSTPQRSPNAVRPTYPNTYRTYPNTQSNNRATRAAPSRRPIVIQSTPGGSGVSSNGMSHAHGGSGQSRAGQIFGGEAGRGAAGMGAMGSTRARVR